MLSDHAFEFVVTVLQRFGTAYQRVFRLELVERDYVVVVIPSHHVDRVGRVVDQHFRVDTCRCYVQFVVINELRIIDDLFQKAVIGVKTL